MPSSRQTIPQPSRQAIPVGFPLFRMAFMSKNPLTPQQTREIQNKDLIIQRAWMELPLEAQQKWAAEAERIGGTKVAQPDTSSTRSSPSSSKPPCREWTEEQRRAAELLPPPPFAPGPTQVSFPADLKIPVPPADAKKFEEYGYMNPL